MSYYHQTEFEIGTDFGPAEQIIVSCTILSKLCFTFILHGLLTMTCYYYLINYQSEIMRTTVSKLICTYDFNILCRIIMIMNFRHKCSRSFIYLLSYDAGKVCLSAPCPVYEVSHGFVS